MATYTEDVFAADSYQRNQITGEVSRAATIAASSRFYVSVGQYYPSVTANPCAAVIIPRPARGETYAKKRLISAHAYVYVSAVAYSPTLSFYSSRIISYWKWEANLGVGALPFFAFSGSAPSMADGLNYISSGAYLALTSNLMNASDYSQFILQAGSLSGMSNGDGVDASCSLSIHSHLGTNKPYVQFVYEDVTPSVTGAYPQSGFVDEKKANVFGWSMTYSTSGVGTQLSQGSAKFRWRPVGSEYTEIPISSSDSTITIPADTFSTDEIEWQVNVTSDDGIESAFTPWYRLTTIDSVPQQPVPLNPVLAFVDGSAPVTFSWEHTIETGSIPSGFDLEYSSDNGATWTALASETSEATSYVVAPDTLPAGNLQWRVRTYNSDGVVGPWSDPALFVLQAAPQAPAISGVTPSARPVISWQSLGQVAYQVRITSVGYDTGEIAGTAKSHKVRDYLANGDYIAEVRIKNAFSIWSEWASAAFSLAVTPPPAPPISAEAITEGARITIGGYEESVVRAYLLRGGVPIADVTGMSTYIDYAALGSSSYTVRVVNASDNYADSAAVSVTVTVPHAILAAVDALSSTVALMLTRGEPRRLSGSINQTVAYRYFAGRAHPVAVFAEQESENYQTSVAFLEDSDRDGLIALIRRCKTILYRDAWGNRWFVIIPSSGYDQDHFGTSLSIQMTVVDYVEEIEYAEV